MSHGDREDTRERITMGKRLQRAHAEGRHAERADILALIDMIWLRVDNDLKVGDVSPAQKKFAIKLVNATLESLRDTIAGRGES
jgi:hypothetical protein